MKDMKNIYLRKMVAMGIFAFVNSIDLAFADDSRVWISDLKPQLDGVAAYGDDPAPVFRGNFDLKKIEDAFLSIAALGYYDIELNGKKLTSTSLMPLWTVADKTILEDDYGVKEFLRVGENEIRVTLGNGWYNPLPMKMFQRFNFREYIANGRPRFSLSIKAKDGTVLLKTGENWSVGYGPVIRNNVYLGVKYDARKKTIGKWGRVKVCEIPEAKVLKRTAPAIIPQEKTVAGDGRMLESIEGKKKVYRQIIDFGKNGSGVPTFNFGKGAKGEVITIRYGELLNPDGTLNPMTAVFGQVKRGGGGEGCPELAEAVDTYIRSGDGEEIFTPPFTFHAFRYAEITGLKKPLKAGDAVSFVHASDLKIVSKFECSREDFNRLHEVCRRTFISNLVGVQSDCPGRERLGYGGDIAASAETMALNYDMREFYLKALRDFCDDAEKQGGWFTETSPYIGIADRGFGGASGSISWTVAVPIMMETLIRYYGEKRVFEFYPACVRYLRLVDGKCPNGIIPDCIGDHECLERGDNSVVATIYYREFARIIAKMARLQNLAEDAAEFEALEAKILRAFREKFVSGGKVGPKGVQGEQALALFFKMLPDSEIKTALDILIEDVYEHGGALTTGIFGTRALLMYLSESGHGDLAGRVASYEDFPGYLNMLKNGATTLWEHWQEETMIYSHNHPMFGTVDEWFIRCVLGIRIADDAFGADKVIISPTVCAGITYAKGSLDTPHGTIKVEWTLLENGKIDLKTDIPDGIAAKIVK
jgi:alpha-L-rhamnosidase